jgi:glycosyltransferase 2 family protein
LPITISKLFADQVVPTSGMSGNLLLVERLIARDVPRRNAVAAAILAIFAYYVSYAVCALAAAILLWLHGGISWLLIAATSIFLLLAAAIPTGILWLQGKGSTAMPHWLERFGPIRKLFDMVGEAPDELVRNPRLVGQLSLLNGAVWIADVLTLQVCTLALGQAAAFDAAFVALIIASIIATIGPVPLGLGSFEGSAIAMLSLMGIPFEAALSATLLYRGFTLWLPLIAGLILSRRELKRRSS